ncbi:hypothetical protein NUSPORA_02892 [Nucleospora cyclopteri]
MIEFKFFNFVCETKSNLQKILNIVLMIFKSDSSKLKIDTFLIIYLYVNYLKDAILLHMLQLKSNLYFKKFYANFFNLDSNTLDESLRFILSEQKILGNFIFDFCKIFMIIKQKN